MNNIEILPKTQPQNQDANILCCPKCSASLQLEGSSIKCTVCEFVGSYKDGIYDVRCGRLDYYFNPVPRPLMNELTEETEKEKWPSIIRSFMTSVRNNPDWIDNLVVDGRYAWKLFLSLPEDAVLLDLGCGLGNLVHNLAPQVGKVYALDLTWERLEFSRLRCSLFNSNDDVTYIAGGDGAYLPFPDNSLDCVTLSGVLEWIPDNNRLWETQEGKLVKAQKMLSSFFGSKNPRKIQIAFLREIRRVLKPEGQLFIGIENRLNYEYFTGRPDHHTVLKYGSLLPRFLANIYSIYMRRRPYRTYTHSLGGYRKLLKESGFNKQSYLGLLDGYSKLREILNIDLEGIPWSTDEPATVKNKLKRHKLFVPAFGIIASKHKLNKKPLISELIDLVKTQVPDMEGRPSKLERFIVTGKDKAVITLSNDSREWILKIPFSEHGADSETQGAKILQFLSKSNELADLIPTPVLSGTIRRIPYFVETKVIGESLFVTLNDLNRDSISQQVFLLWKRFLNADSLSKEIVLDDHVFNDLISPDVQSIRAVTAHPEKIEGLLHFLKSTLLGRKFKVGLTHGDYSIHNILIDSSGDLKVIDWETASKNGLVILDLINYMDSVQRGFDDQADIVDTVELLLNKIWPNEFEYKSLVDALELCGFDQEKDTTAAILLYWMHHISLQLKAGMVFNNIQISQRIDRFLLRTSAILAKKG